MSDHNAPADLILDLNMLADWLAERDCPAQANVARRAAERLDVLEPTRQIERLAKAMQALAAVGKTTAVDFANPNVRDITKIVTVRVDPRPRIVGGP